MISLVVGAVAVSFLPPANAFGIAVPPVLLIAYATALGILIDLDHFVVARYKTGSWDAVRFCLGNPIAVFTDQDRIFEEGDVGVLSRLLSHLLIGGVLVSILALESVPLAVLTAFVLYVHLVCDVAWDIHGLRRREEAFGSRAADR